MKLRLLCLALTALILTGRAGAADLNFTAEQFGTETGVLLTETPAEDQGTLLLGTRTIRSGDVLTAGQLSELRFVPVPGAEGEAVLTCLRLTEGAAEEVRLTLGQGGAEKNQPPAAEDSEFTTYQNIPGQVPLTVSDPENGALEVRILRQPKRGTVEVLADGTVCYTPGSNKVGRDSFTYTVTDPGGLTSEEATVRVRILRPADRQTYGDMDGDPAALAAAWLREEGIFSGETVSGTLLFGPDKIVTRGEFLAMCAGLTGDERETLSTGFADEAATASWMGPYAATALRWGYLSGVPTEGGLSLLGEEPVTQAQAVKLVSGLLGLRAADAESVMAEQTEIPAWAEEAAGALAGKGIFTVTEPQEPMTRRDAALLLYRAAQYARTDQGLLAWAAR